MAVSKPLGMVTSRPAQVLDVVTPRNLLLLGGALTALYAGNHGSLGRYSFALISVITCVAILVGVRRHRPSAVAGWYVLAAAMPCFALAGLVQNDDLETNVQASAEVIDHIFSICAYMLLIVGFGILIRRRVRLTAETVLDVSIFVIGVGSVIGVFIISPVIRLHDMSMTQRAMAVTYPIADVLLLALLSLFLFARQGRSVAVTLLIIAATSALVVDTAAAILIQREATDGLHWLSLGYAVALLAFGTAALHESMVTLSEPASTDISVSAGGARLVGLGLALMAGPAELSVERYVLHRTDDFWPLILLTAIIVVLAMLRMRCMFKSIQDSEERFRSMAQNSSDLILVCDPVGDITYASQSAQDVLGCASDDLLHTSLIDLIAPDDQERIVRVLSTLAGRCSVRSVPFAIGHMDGTYRCVEAHFANLLANGAVRGFFVNLYDTTERTTLENELRQAQKLESVGQLASGIAHEINTPIQFVGDNVRFLEDAFNTLVPGDDGGPGTSDIEFYKTEIPEAIRQTLDGVDRVAEIVRAMKAFGHPGTDNKAFADLNEAVRNSLVVTSNAVKQYARIETDLGELPLVRCHIGDVNQVLINLLINAAHAIADQGRQTLGRITVRTRQDGRDVVVEIADTGTGIPLEIADRIFEPFFTTKEVGRGTGQGLALAYTLIKDRHGGAITFTSTPGRGTTFCVRLPVDSDEANELAELASSSQLLQGGTYGTGNFR